MNSYRQYWLLTGLLLAAVLYAIYNGVIGWALSKFPELQVQIVSATIIGIFCWAYFKEGHSVALMLARNERALDGGAAKCTVVEIIDITKKDRERLKHQGQTDFSALYTHQTTQLEKRLEKDLGLPNVMRDFLFLIALTFTVAAIVMGFSQLVTPTNPEEAKTFSAGIIRALGFAYLPSFQCVTGFAVLYILTSMLEMKADELLVRADRAVFDAAMFDGGGTHA